jgi:hypothetical protein
MVAAVAEGPNQARMAKVERSKQGVLEEMAV